MKSKTIKFWAIVMGISGVIALALATNYFMNREFLMGPISSLAGISNIQSVIYYPVKFWFSGGTPSDRQP